MPGSTANFYPLASNLKVFAAFAWRLLLLLLVSRTLLVIWQWDRVADAAMLVPVFVQGLRFDLLLLGIALLLPTMLLPVFASTKRLAPLWGKMLVVYFSLLLLVVAFMEVATPSFINEYDSRPNILFVEYLDHPREVGAMLWAAYKIPLLFGVVFVLIFTALNVRQLRNVVRRVQPMKALHAIAITPLLLIICFGMIRSTLDHRAVNPSTVATSSDPLINDLALSSAYTVLYASYEMRHEPEGGARYARVEDESVIALVRNGMHIPPQDFTSDLLPTLHVQKATRTSAEPLNLVIIVEESLGAEFVGAMGGLDLTPNLDELTSEGIWFSSLYATGTRSVRGLEAVVAGFTPTPARSVVKLGKSQKGFFTLAELLCNVGYESSFIYGGESQFDNMRRFFMGNGFEHVIDKRDYKNPVFTGSWGVSDEDLLNRAHIEFSAEHEKSFFSLIFTSSNHSPFQFPDGRVELLGEEKNTVDNAVKYADYALGRFIRNAKKSDYWDNTVFLIVADHNSRVYGSEVVPIERFHIPGLILGGSITPRVIDAVASQIDLAPTLLSLLGISAEHPMIGHDLTEPDETLVPGRAIMQFNGTQAYMQGDRAVVLQKDLPMRQYTYADGHLTAATYSDKLLARTALAHSAWSSIAYEQSLYRLPRRADKL